MPRDAHLLSPMSQALLRAARMGQVNKPPPPPLEDEKEAGEDDEAEGDIDAGFVAKRWAVVPRHLEEAEPEYLAKRRKGLPSVYRGGTVPVGGVAPMRKTKIRKIDANGNAYVWEVLIPEGQKVEGEIVEEETTLTEAAAPGTVVEGVGVVNAEGVVIAGDQVLPTPPRRRPPPPKRKPKGPGRGRKKKVAFTPSSGFIAAAQEANGSSDVVLAGIEGNESNKGPDPGIVKDDVEMGEDSVLQDGEEGGEEGTEDDDEGDDGEEGDRDEGELSPSPSSLSKSPSKAPQPKPEPDSDRRAPDPVLEGPVIVPFERDLSSSPDLPLAATQVLQPLLIVVEPVEDTVVVPPPEMNEILEETSASGPILVEEIPTISPAPITAEIPAEHNPLDGLTEPSLHRKESSETDVLFPDGEEDLLGSLERHLDQRDS